MLTLKFKRLFTSNIMPQFTGIYFRFSFGSFFTLHFKRGNFLIDHVYALFSSSESVCEICIFVVQSLSRVQLFVTPWPVAHQAPLSPGFSQARLLEWGASPFSRGSSRPRGQPWSPVSQGDSLPSESAGHFIGLSKYNRHL